MLKEAEGQYPVLLHLSLKIVVFSKIQYKCTGTLGSSVSLISWHELIITVGAFNLIMCCWKLKEQCRLQNSRFRSFRKARSALSVILECESREPHMPCGRVRRENDCRLFIQRIRSKWGSYNVTEVTEIA